MKKPAIQNACTNLFAAFQRMNQLDFIAGIQASYGYQGNDTGWQNEAENAIESLRVMAWHGDEKSINSLICLGNQIASILDNFAWVASEYDEDSEDTHTKSVKNLLRQKEDNDGERGGITETDLELLASNPAHTKKLREDLDKCFPGHTTLFDPEYLLKNPCFGSDNFLLSYAENTEDEIPPHASAPSPSRYQTLGDLTGKLAGIRALMDCIRLVRKAMDSADGWPVALSPIKQLRTAQLKRFESLQIGSELPYPLNPPPGSGNTGELGKGGTPDFYFSVFYELERERTYPRAPAHLMSIDKTYKDFLNPSTPSNDTEAVGEDEMKPSMRSNWNERNEWKALTALLKPLSTNEDVIEEWVKAGVMLVRSKSNGFTAPEIFPNTLLKEMTESTDYPTTRRVETEVRKALKKGFGVIATRIEQARQIAD
jgi:hypothetical protein